MTKYQGDGSMDPDFVRSTASQYERHMAVMDTEKTEISNIFQRFTDKGGHKGALKTALKIHNMESAKALDYWRALNSYLHILGTLAQLDMFEAQDAPKADTVVPIGKSKGGKKAAKASGGEPDDGASAPAPAEPVPQDDGGAAAEPVPLAAEGDGEAVLAVEAEGAAACRAGRLGTDNPYSEDDGELYDAWLRGYNTEFEAGGAAAGQNAA